MRGWVFKQLLFVRLSLIYNEFFSVNFFNRFMTELFLLGFVRGDADFFLLRIGMILVKDMFFSSRC